jgi:2-polyprenyl-3-methyl-5-hydroxy-6-metoxy-1,4-benzoquinol methylase
MYPMDLQDDDELAARYFGGLAEAFVRGRLGVDAEGLEGAPLLRLGLARGLRLHKFKRNDDLPRVRRVLGILRGLSPASLLDVGSGRGTFLWPLLDALPGFPVTAIDRDPRRATDLAAVARGGIHRLEAREMDVTRLDFEDGAFDVVTALEILEHLRDPKAGAREVLRVARRAVIVSVPSKEDDNPDHHQLFDEQSLAALFTDGTSAPRRIATERVRGHIVAVVHR